jgi:CTP:molybdopterin cytidylyltransferase MocA
MKTLLIVVLLTLTCGVASATPYSTAALKTDCDFYVTAGVDSGIAATFCAGYVLAFTQMEEGYTVQTTDGPVYQYSWADGVTADQVIRVFVKYVNDHPELLNKSAIETLLRATGDTGLRTGASLAKPIVAKEQ